MRKYLEIALNHQQRLLPIVIIAFFLIASKIWFTHSKYVVLFGTTFKILLFLFALFVPGFFLLKLLKKDYFDNNTAFLLAAPTSITVFSIIFIILQIFKSPPLWYFVFNIGVTILIISMAYKSKITKEILYIDNTLKHGFILIVIGAVMATSYIAVNTDNPLQEINTWSIPANRGFHQLPIDNNLQYDTAMVFAHYQQPWSWGASNWTMGDRPPLLGVVNATIALSLATPAELLFNLKPFVYPFWYYEIIGIVLNVLFILPLIFLAKQIFNHKIAIYLIPLAVLLNGFIFLNIYFTWPKLLATYFALLSIALLLNSKPITITNAFITGWLWALAALSHGGAILSLPVLFILYSFYLLRTIKLTHYLKYLMVFLTAFIIFQSPWTAYKKMHPAIDTVKLYYFYIPTEFWPQEGLSFASKNTMTAMMTFLQAYPLEKQLSVRWGNLKQVITQHTISDTINAMISGNWKAYHDKLYPAEFFYPITAIGEVQILLSIVILFIYLLVYLSKLKRDKLLLPFNIKLLSLAVAFILISYLFNILLKWGPSHNHEMSYLELVIAIALFAGISFSVKYIMIFSLGMIGIRFSYYLIYSSIQHNYHIFDFFNVIVIISVILAIYLANLFSQLDKRE